MTLDKVLLTCLAATALYALPDAQARSTKAFARYGKPLQSVHVDVATGTITRGPRVADRGASTVLDFFNNDLSGFVGVDTGNGFCEWFDAGVKGFNGNASDLVTSITFAYCTAMLAPGSGGPGGSLAIGFYEGYTVGGGSPTTGVAVLTLTGLPGNSASSSFANGFSCFFTAVDFGGNLVAYADGPIGYSWGFLDMGTDGTLAGTFPFLACVVSCSGTFLQVDGQGMTDVIDQYCPPGTLRSTFTFGTSSGTFTSMSLDIREVTDLASTKVHYNATTTPNTDTLTATNPVVGTTWTVTLTRSPVTAAGLFAVELRPNRVAGNGNPPPAGVEGRLLISGGLLASLPGTHDGTTGSVNHAIPAQLALVCTHFAAQATAKPASAGFVARLSSAMEGTTGTF
jgi:hypothetical protein